MPKRFAEKSETKRALQSLESRIHALLEVSGGIRNGEDAMIARKPLGGWSCLSCEKQLEKLKGRMASYQPWNKMPRRDPADRIARVGPGFSKMLATFQPELLSSRSRQQGQRRHSPQDGEVYDEDLQGEMQLPKVKGHERPFTAALP